MANMAHKELKRGAKEPEVGNLQTLLNRVGAMLKPDGDFGGGTEQAVKYAQKIAGQPQTGVANAALWAWLEQQPEPSTLLPGNCVAFIAAEETGGLQYYDATTRFPHWPGEQSGITLGVGYDLRMNNAVDFQNTWKRLPATTTSELLKDIGLKGSKTRAGELKKLGIEVPFELAWPVFTSQSLPTFHRETQRSYPSLDTLPDKCRAVLISLVYNRGASVKGTNREEMLGIQQLLAQAANPALGKEQRKAILVGVEDQLLAMRRLWNPGSGLVTRRKNEANYWREGLAEW
jgi:hypothetical protein